MPTRKQQDSIWDAQMRWGLNPDGTPQSPKRRKRHTGEVIGRATIDRDKGKIDLQFNFSDHLDEEAPHTD